MSKEQSYNSLRDELDRVRKCYDAMSACADKRGEELTRLRAENERLSVHLQMASSAKLSSELNMQEKNELVALRNENEELRKALEPFAIDSDPTEHPGDDIIGTEFTWGQCRRAAEILNRKTP